MPKEKEASLWLIAERARCRREALVYARDQFDVLPIEDAMKAVNARIAYYEAVIKNPQKTGIPGE